MRSDQKNEIATLLDASGGVIARRQHPELVEAMNRLVRSPGGFTVVRRGP